VKTRPGTAIYNPPGTAGGTAAKWDPGITSLTDLAAVATVDLAYGAIRAWINADDGTEQVWRGMNSSLDTQEGVQRPNDYTPLRPWAWFKASS